MDKLKILQSLVGSPKAYIQKTSHWFKVDGSIKNKLQDHIDGKIIVGTYPIYWEKTVPKCRFVAIDIDAHSEDENKYNFLEAIKILYSRAEFFFKCSHKHLILEETDNGYHIWIPLKDGTKLDDVFYYVSLIKPNIEQVIGIQEFFPKQFSVSKKDYGNGIKLPFYNKKTNLILFNGIKPLDITDLIKDYKKKASNLKYQKKIPKSELNYVLERGEEGEIPEVLKDIYESPFLKPCIKDIIKGKYKAVGDNGHLMRVAVANELLSLGKSVAETAMAFINQDDWDYETSYKQTKYSARKQEELGTDLSFNCSTIDDLGFCKPTCPYNHRSSTSSTLVPKEKIKGLNSWDELHSEMNKLVNKKEGVYFLEKTTRSGTTTATVVQAFKEKKKILMVAPTKEIYDKTVKTAQDIFYDMYGYMRFLHTYRIKSNFDSCRILKEQFADNKDEILEIFPFILKPDCRKCKFKDNCSFTKFLDSMWDYDLIYLTTAKLKALINSPNSSYILNQLIKWCDVIFIDECSHIFSVNYNSQILIDEEDMTNIIPYLRFALNNFSTKNKQFLDSDLFDIFLEFIGIVEECIAMLKDRDKSSLIRINALQFEEVLNEHPELWSKLYSIMIKDFATNQQKSIRYMVMMFLSLSSRTVYLQQIISNNKFRKIILANVDDLDSIVNFLKTLQTERLIVMTDAIAPPIKLENIFDSLTKIEINDPNNTAEKQKIVIFEDYDPFFDLSKEVANKMGKFLDRENINEFFVIFKSKKVYSLYVQHNGELESGEHDWYRGEKTIGTESELRRMITFGSPQPPRHSYDYIAHSFKEKNYLEDVEDAGRYLENYSAKSAFFQTISRSKDPMGDKVSFVYVYGTPKKMIESYLDLRVATPEIINKADFLKRFIDEDF